MGCLRAKLGMIAHVAPVGAPEAEESRPAPDTEAS
jgi:hypothetical protein